MDDCSSRRERPRASSRAASTCPKRPGRRSTSSSPTGSRVVAVATRTARSSRTVTPADEHGLTLAGYLVFLDQPKADAAESLRRLADLGITVKVVTGDNAVVAEKICRDLGLDVKGVLTGAEIAALDDDALATRVLETTIFARVEPRAEGATHPCAPRR